MKRITIAAALIASLFGISAQAQDLSGAGFTAAQLRSGADVYVGTIEQLLSANADKGNSSRSNMGAGVGAVLGGLAGNNMGKGDGKIATTLLGAVLGGVAGNAAANVGTSEACALTFIVKLDGVEGLKSYTQECTPKYQFVVGQKIYLLVAKLDGTKRVVPAQ